VSGRRPLDVRRILDDVTDEEIAALEERLPERVKITVDRDGSFRISFTVELQEPDYGRLERAARRARSGAGTLVRQACDRAVQELLDAEPATKLGRRLLDEDAEP